MIKETTYSFDFCLFNGRIYKFKSPITGRLISLTYPTHNIYIFESDDYNISVVAKSVGKLKDEFNIKVSSLINYYTKTPDSLLNESALEVKHKLLETLGL